MEAEQNTRGSKRGEKRPTEVRRRDGRRGWVKIGGKLYRRFRINKGAEFKIALAICTSNSKLKTHLRNGEAMLVAVAALMVDIQRRKNQSDVTFDVSGSLARTLRLLKRSRGVMDAIKKNDSAVYEKLAIRTDVATLKLYRMIAEGKAARAYLQYLAQNQHLTAEEQAFGKVKLMDSYQQFAARAKKQYQVRREDLPQLLDVIIPLRET